MAIVPMTDGPKVNPTVPDAKPISILEPRESKIATQSIANAQASSNGLLKAARESYERMSDARATEAYNNVRIAVNDLLMGENGALTKVGTEVTDSKKPFVQDYYEQIEKIFDENTKDLDNYQKQLLEGRKQRYLANRRMDLTKHLIKQADAVQIGVAKNAAEIAVDTITANPRDLDSVKEAIEEIEKNARIMMRGQDESVIRSGIDKTVSGALVSAITVALVNNNPEEAEALRRHYHKKGLSALDELKIQPKIKEALEKKIQAMKTEQAVNAVTQSLTTESILSRVMPKGDGKEFDAKRYQATVNLVTENGLDSGVAPYLYYLGDWGVNIVNDWKAEKEKALKEGAPVPAPPSIEELRNNVSDLQRLAIDEFYKTTSAINSGDKEVISEQVYLANPNIDPKTADSTIKFIHENRQRSIAIGKAQANSQASQVFAMLRNGRRFADIPSVEMDALPDHVKEGLKEYDRRKALNSFTTDSNLYASLAYDNEALKTLSWGDFYGLAGRFSQEDFKKLAERKQALDQYGDKGIKEAVKGLSSKVDFAIERLGVKPKGDTQKRTLNSMKRTVYEFVEDKINEDPKRAWTDEDVTRIVNEALKTEIRVNGIWDFTTDHYTVAHLLTEEENLHGYKSSLHPVLNAGLRANGFPEPNDLDRNELVVKVLLSSRKSIPGARQMFEVIPASKRAELIQQARKEGITPTPDMIVAAFINDSLSAE